MAILSKSEGYFKKILLCRFALNATRCDITPNSVWESNSLDWNFTRALHPQITGSHP